jgi:signal transduction histidine kinase
MTSEINPERTDFNPGSWLGSKNFAGPPHRAHIAAFAAKAFQERELDVLLRKACAHAADGLGVERARILEYQPDTNELLLRAGIGWREGVVGRTRLPADLQSPPGEAYRTGKAIVMDDIDGVPDLRSAGFLRRHGVIALLGVPIEIAGLRFGVLEADANAPRQFSADDRQFLVELAAVLAAAIHRLAGDGGEQGDPMQALAKAKKILEAAAAAKDRALATMGHDLKQPLQIINMCLERLAGRSWGDTEEYFISRALHAVTKLARGLDYMIIMAQLGRDLLEPRFEPVEAGQLLRQLSQDFQPLVDDKGLVLRSAFPRARIRTDKNLLMHVLENLVGNAIKYTEKGRILIGARRRAGGLVIEVHDTGIGIPPHRLEEIFEEFHRVDAAHGDGVGLGLAIAKRLTGLLGHRLSVRSVPGKGSCFSVEIPLAACELTGAPAGTAIPSRDRNRAEAARNIVIAEGTAARTGAAP